MDVVRVGARLEAGVEAFAFTEDAFITVARVDVCVVVQDEEFALYITEKLLEVLGAGGVAGGHRGKGCRR